MMKKYLITLCCAVVAISASAQGKLAVNAGFLFPSTLNATIGYERPLSYGNTVELYGEAGTHWQEKDFWKGYYWDGGVVYKHRLGRYKNLILNGCMLPILVLLYAAFPLRPAVRRGAKTVLHRVGGRI